MKKFFSKLAAKFASFTKREKILSIVTAILASLCCGGVVVGIVLGTNKGGATVIEYLTWTYHDDIWTRSDE